MRVFVTGAAGFLGSHLVDALVDAGHEVVGLDNLRSGSKSFVQAHIDSGALRMQVGDIRDPEAVRKAMHRIEFVYHLAAQSNVMGSLADPDYSFTTNVVGTYNVLKAAASGGVQRLVFSSSREVYGDQAVMPVREDAPLAAKNPYGASKIAGEVYCRAWQKTPGLDCLILRFGNLYGPRDTARVIPRWLNSALRGEDLVLYGGHQVLDFVWVGTAVECLMSAMTSANDGPVNVGSGRGTLLKDLAKKVIGISGGQSRIVRKPAREAEVARFVADNARMMETLGVTPLTDSLSCLHRVVESLREEVAV